MTHIVISDHVQSLKSGRMVGPGDPVSDAEAKQNQPLIDRGVLVKETKKVAKKADQKSSENPAAEPHEQEDDK